MGESSVMDCLSKEFLNLSKKVESAISQFQHKTGRIVTGIKIEVQDVNKIDDNSVRIKQLFIYTHKEFEDEELGTDSSTSRITESKE